MRRFARAIGCAALAGILAAVACESSGPTTVTGTGVTNQPVRSWNPTPTPPFERAPAPTATPPGPSGTLPTPSP